MIWLFAALAILLFVVLAGRAHSRYLDALEACWHSPSIDNWMTDENWEHLRARRNSNVRRYRRLLQTELAELERQYIERRLKKSPMESLTSSAAALQNHESIPQLSCAEKKPPA